jgi:hypothetical protein
MKISSLYFVYLAISLGALACVQGSRDPAPAPAPAPADDFFTSSYEITGLPISTAFEAAKELGAVEDLALNEISGVAVSFEVPDALWTEEDSGNENKIYLITKTGKSLGSFRMTSVSDRDWEDMAISTGPILNVRYLYLAETGDNNYHYPVKSIYRFPEPSITNKPFPLNEEIPIVETISFKYPDGIKNSEAVMVDPVSHDIYIISKEGQATIYVARFPQALNSVFTITKLGTLPISDVTSADISQDGTEILVKNYSLMLYWKKSSSESISELLKKTPQRAPYTPEPKGESVCWAADASGYFTISEMTDNNPTKVYFYQRK